MNSVSSATPEPADPGQPNVRGSRTPGLHLVYYPDPVLRTVCSPVETFDSALRDVVEEMFALMRAYAGIGLAGPQVSVEQRLLVCAIDGRQLCLTNPVIGATADPGELVEGCLSMPDVAVSVRRPERIHVLGYDHRGQRIQLTASGLWARVIQHELDHLNGVLISDRGNPVAQPYTPSPPSVPAALLVDETRSTRTPVSDRDRHWRSGGAPPPAQASGHETRPTH